MCCLWSAAKPHSRAPKPNSCATGIISIPSRCSTSCSLHGRACPCYKGRRLLQQRSRA